MSDFLPLQDLLRRRVALIADHAFRDRDATGHLAALQHISEALTAEHQRMRSRLPARLNHFLTQASFAKALAYLESPDSNALLDSSREPER